MPVTNLREPMLLYTSTMSNSVLKALFALTPAPDHIPLRAGPLTLTYDAGDLRYVRMGEHEVVRRIYAAVRDRNWTTVPGVIRDEERTLLDDSFRIRYVSEHRQNEIDFVWRAEIIGTSDGTVEFTFDGEARSTFQRNRIGFCVLHPASCAGRRCCVERAGGQSEALQFPKHVEAAQPVPGIHDLRTLSHEIAAGLWAELEFEGDLFEMEDQRNWIDSSFKTFCTPLRIPYPVELKAATLVRQKVRLKIVRRVSDGEVPVPIWPDVRRSKTELVCADRDPTCEFVDVALAHGRLPIPSVGLGVGSHGRPLTARESAVLCRLAITHLRADLRLGNTSWGDDLLYAHQQARALSVSLELAVHLPGAMGETELPELGRRLRDLQTPLARILVFCDTERTASAASHLQVRSALEFLGVPFGAGTNADFYQLNQFRPPPAADFVHWSMNPQVHAFDIGSLIETPTAIPAQLHSARLFFPGKPLVVSPVTLKPRFNPVATGPERSVQPGELPPEVDPRQLTPFCAAWTLAVIKQLAESGAASLTLFETTGWRGVVETEAGSPLPGKFPSQAGQAFPVYYVIGEVGRFRGGEVVVSTSSDPLRVESLALTRKGSTCLYLVNMTGELQVVQTRGFKRAIHRRDFDWSQTALWMFAPEIFVRETDRTLSPAGEAAVDVELPPFGFTCLEVET